MKISENELSRLLATSTSNRRYNRQALGASTAETPSNTDNKAAAQVSVSSMAQDVQHVKRYVNDLPDTRAERVAQLKAQVENGTYHVSGEDIADLMIRRIIADNSYF